MGSARHRNRAGACGRAHRSWAAQWTCRWLPLALLAGPRCSRSTHLYDSDERDVFVLVLLRSFRGSTGTPADSTPRTPRLALAIRRRGLATLIISLIICSLQGVENGGASFDGFWPSSGLAWQVSSLVGLSFDRAAWANWPSSTRRRPRPDRPARRAATCLPLLEGHERRMDVIWPQRTIYGRCLLATTDFPYAL
jgi:hypothetical protein